MKKFQGIFPPTITPFSKDGKVDEDGLRKNINFWIENGVHGLVPNGSNGEAINLTFEERKQILEIVVDETNDRVPIIAGTGDSSTDRAIKLTKTALDVGVDATLIVTPFYFQVNQESIFEYYSDIAKACDIPIFLYAVPKFTGLEIEPSTASKLAETYDNIVGIKMSIVDARKISDMIHLTRNLNFQVLSGSGSSIYPTLALGGSGAIVAICNVAPKLCANVYNDFIKGDVIKARDIQLKLIPLDIALTVKYGIPGLKVAMEMLGLPAGIPRKPLLPVSADVRKAVKNY